MFLTILMVLLATDTSGYQNLSILRSFEDPEEHDDILQFPYDAVFTEEGELFAVDLTGSRVFCWNADGSFKMAFGEPGDGPGELKLPYLITNYEDKLIIFGMDFNMSIFKTDGTFVRRHKLPAQLRVARMVNKYHIAVTYQQQLSRENIRIRTDLIDLQATPVRNVGDFSSNFFSGPIKGFNKTTIKSYGPDSDVQLNPNGKGFYVSYSEDPILYHYSSNGKKLGEKTFELKTSPPTDSEIEAFQNLSVLTPGGSSFDFSKAPNLKIDFEAEKAFFTHFAIKGNKAAFFLTPLGSLKGLGNGYHTGEFTICDFESGKALKKGRYSAPEDSVLLFRNNRIIGIVYEEDGSQRIKELSLTGF